jgi:hypothetical protein
MNDYNGKLSSNEIRKLAFHIQAAIENNPESPEKNALETKSISAIPEKWEQDLIHRLNMEGINYEALVNSENFSVVEFFIQYYSN